MKACALTDTGRVRTANQDYVYASVEPVGSLPNLFVVADGMGGHQAGDYASRYIVENLVSYLQYTENSQIVPLLREAILKVNTMLYHEAKEKPEFSGMGTTLVAAVADENTLYVANVGDSRLYLVRDRIRQVTRDHSYVEELVSLGRLERGSKDYKDKKNIITRAVGTEDKLLVDFVEVGLEPGDFILMCSDGLSNMLEDQSMYEIITGEGSLKEKAALLIEEANRQGGIDNIAVVLVSPSGREAGVC